MKYGRERRCICAFLLIIALADFSTFLSSSQRLQLPLAQGSTLQDSLVSSNGTWAIGDSQSEIPGLNNVLYLFGNQSIPYMNLSANAIVSLESIDQYVGLVLWTNLSVRYNATAVKMFAATRPVICNILDFCSSLYPELGEGLRVVSTATVTYQVDWGNFRKDDSVEMHNGTYSLAGIRTSYLRTSSNVTIVSTITKDVTALFQMAGRNSESGFFVMDLSATRPNSYEAGNWHLFPAIAKAGTVRAGRYSRWMTDGLSWRSLEYIYGWLSNFTDANGDIVTLQNIGSSVLGRPIYALFIGRGSKYFISDASIHGVEKAGTHALLRFAELILDWYRVQSDWRAKLSEYTLILVPVLNPDGYFADTRNNANGKDLNRQFPPAQTTEPEAWALRRLMENYPPTQYVSLHTGGELSPLCVYYSCPTAYPYKDYTSWVINESNLLFQDLKHWGIVYDSVWVGRFRHVGQLAVNGSLSASYASRQYGAMAITAEHFSWPKANLHSQEYYMSILLGLLLHYDKSQSLLVYSSGFITKMTIYDGTGVTFCIDKTCSSASGSPVSRIFDLSQKGKPADVYLDNARCNEGNGWYWNNVSRLTTVTGICGTALLVWSSRPPWDVNQDGSVNMVDLAMVARAFGRTVKDADWNQLLDVNTDGRVDLLDLSLTCLHFLENYSHFL